MVKMCFQLLFVLLVARQVVSNLVGPRFYQEDGESLFNFNDIIEIPDSCKGKPYCFERGDDYPYELIDTLVKDFSNNMESDPEARISIGSRSGVTDDQLECKRNYDDSLIYYITDTNNKQRVVVQSQDEGQFRQNHIITRCSEEGATNSTTHFLKGIKCVTKTMNLEFFVLSENYISDKTKITVAKAAIPVCCRCELDTEEGYRKFDQIRQNLMNKSN